MVLFVFAITIVVNYCRLFLLRCLQKVSASVLPYFNAAAEKLIEERGAVEVVSAALAYISGVTEIKSRSLLSSQPVSLYSVYTSYTKIAPPAFI